MNRPMFHYIQSQLSMSEDVSVQRRNDRGAHADSTCILSSPLDGDRVCGGGDAASAVASH